jgi:hypothetical protein
MVFPWKPMELNLKSMVFHGQPLEAKVSHGFPWEPIALIFNTMDFHGIPMETHRVELESHGFPWATIGSKSEPWVSIARRIIGTEANHGLPWADHGNPLCSTLMP